MQWSDIPRRPPPRMLRQFAGLWLLAFSALAWYYAARGEPGTAAVLGVLAATLGPLGLLVPAVIRPVFVAWMILVFPVGWAVSRLALVLMFVCLITPVALFFRLRGRDLLQLKRPASRTSYWTPKPAPGRISEYFRQY